MKNIIILIFISVILISGCGPGADFDHARSLEKRGYYVEAGLEYDKLVRENPDYPKSPEALYRLGKIYQKKIKLYPHAKKYFQNLIDSYPDALPWSESAKREILNCPDYFPLTNGSFWIEGDSATGGRNMRAEWNCQEISSGTFRITRKISAGAKLVTTIYRYFRKAEFEFREYTDKDAPAYTIVYSYPLEKGREWKTSRDGRMILCRILEKDIPVSVKAGNFTGCIKISEESPSLPGSRKFNYYAPDVGWILTTTSASGQEFRNTELISYKIMPANE
ncbi:MAG: hypothetical protein ABII64_05800 [Elusimicrobiota bacterium]